METDDSVLVTVCIGTAVVVIDEEFPLEGLPGSEVVTDMVTDGRPDVTVSAEDVPSAGSVEEDIPGKVDTGVVDVSVLSVTEMEGGCEIEDVTTVEVDGALPVVSEDEVDEGVRGPVAEEPVETEGPAPVLPMSVAVFTGKELSVKLHGTVDEIVAVLALVVDCSKVLLGGRAEVGYVAVSVPGKESEELLVEEVAVSVAEYGRLSVGTTLKLDMKVFSNVDVDE